ncbi:MAG: phosphotransferase [Caldilineaceae bacterium]
MEQQIKDRYHATILQQAMQRYAIAHGQIQLLGACESFIYGFERDSHAYILRISHSLRRSATLIQGEVDWINYLADGGVAVAKAVLSAGGQLVEAIADGAGGHFLATAFVKAEGEPPWELWSPTLYTRYGQLIGNIHALTEVYQPSGASSTRPAWDEDLFEFVDRFLPATQTVVREKFQQVLDHLQTLPKDKTSYGLIHYDAHGNNFLVDAAGAITLFDFDDCVYSWFCNDIAIALFYIVQDAEDAPAFTHEFMTHFLAGYQQSHHLEQCWLQEIPAFLKVREILLYAAMYRDYGEKPIDNEWAARFMHDRQTKIEQDLPFIDFDFTSLTVGR